MPRSVSKMANKEATEAATMPRGASQATNSFCRQFRSLRQVHSHTLKGRTTSIRQSTVAKAPHPSANTALSERVEVSRINNTEMAITTNWP